MAIITKLQYCKNNKNRVNVYVDNKYAFTVNEELIYTMGLRKNREIDSDEIEEAMKKDDFLKAKSKAFNIIARSYPSEAILKRKLSRTFDEETSKKAVDKIKEIGLVDDRELAGKMVRDGLNFKRYGRNRIKQDMIKKGIDRYICDEVLDEFSFDSDFENAMYHAEKKMKSIKVIDRKTLHSKLAPYLNYRGFGYDTINAVIENLISQKDSEER